MVRDQIPCCHIGHAIYRADSRRDARRAVIQGIGMFDTLPPIMDEGPGVRIFVDGSGWSLRRP
jgi:hypothetical protein